MKPKIVYILGAGCSYDLGYPLAKDFEPQLRAFSGTLNDGSVKRRIESTLRLLDNIRTHYASVRIDTLDALVKWISDHRETMANGELPRVIGPTEWPFRANPFQIQRTTDLDDCEDAQVLDAKLATAAFFLSLERDVFSKSLDPYNAFLKYLFGTGARLSELRTTASAVLTFNYDRVFEIAFKEFFRVQNYFLYGPVILNSGCKEKPCDELSFDPGFTFLKLHGSVGWRVSKRPSGDGTGRRYDLCVPQRGKIDPTDDNFVSQFGTGDYEPLLLFPEEKRRNGTAFPNDPYISAIWERAAELVQAADEVRTFGYRFSEVDREYVVNKLFSKAKPGLPLKIFAPKGYDIANDLRNDRLIQENTSSIDITGYKGTFGSIFDAPT